MEHSPLRDFLELPYEQLEALNLEAKAQRADRVDPGQIAEKRHKYLADEKRIKAVTVCFSDLEGRLHMLDYDKKFLLRAGDHLTFDGSSIRGFTEITESDLMLDLDWPAFYWLPADIFGPGKVIVFARVLNRDGSPFAADFRSRLAAYCDTLYERDKTVAYFSAEIEGFNFKGVNAEQVFHETGGFEFISTGGYYHSLPCGPLREFIDSAAEVQRAMAFANEKDHPEVGPSQFEMNFSHSEARIAADQMQLYKLVCRQVAQRMGRTASFLPKPVTGVNGSGMHCNISLARDGANLFYDKKGREGLSDLGWKFVDRILQSADDLCLVLNSSVNSYRRLDPNYEAPNEIKASAINRSAMIRIPFANQRSARIEVRSVSPDANPYLLLYSLLRTGLEGADLERSDDKRPRTRFLPDNIQTALRSFKRSDFLSGIMGERTHAKYAQLKRMVADRCPKELGERIKPNEIMFHHEVTNQLLWSMF